MKEFRMPSLGADMDTGTLVEWLKKPGDELRRGDIIAVVETQKGAIEIEMFDAGVLETMLAKIGDKVPVGHALATIRAVGEGVAPDAAKAATAIRPEPAPPRAPSAVAQYEPATVSPSRARVTPVARRLAKERGIDLSNITPGADGVIGLDQVQRVSAPQPKSRPGHIDLAEMRKAIAAAMARANRDIPHYYVSTTIDVTPMMSWLSTRNASRPVEQRILYAAPLVRAVALGFRKYSDLNGFYEDGRFRRAEQVNVGVAIATRGGGLITPAILEADDADVDTMMIRLNDLVKRVRTGGLRSSELSKGTVTLTNLGERTADAIMPIIYPPQVAIIGCGQIRLRPWVVDGAIVPRQLLEVTFAGDHRASDGRAGAQFLAFLESLLAQPEAL